MKRVLIVDDDEVFRRVLSVNLQAAGYETQTADNGRTALRLCRQHSFDLVITDIVMPEKEGLETIIELRRSWPEVMIIAISGDSRMDPGDYLPMARQLGANQILAKPFTSEDIVKLVATTSPGAVQIGTPFSV